MSDPGKAVFISYASQDAPAAKRIADALRATGLEVWFDQNELRGGDAWDAKIRTQIRTCALCIPVISVATQSRGEGYFRREWKIAVERTHDMASGVPFLLPVVIDETAESDALVPDEFMRVQWTRLDRGVPTPQFVEQVRKLLENPRKSAPVSVVGASLDDARGRRQAAYCRLFYWLSRAWVAIVLRATPKALDSPEHNQPYDYRDDLLRLPVPALQCLLYARLERYMPQLVTWHAQDSSPQHDDSDYAPLEYRWT